MAMRTWRPGHSARIQSSKQLANVSGSIRFTNARSQRSQGIIGREFSQEIEMVMAKGGDLVEVVARCDGDAGQQQQDLGQRVDDPPRLTVVFEPGKMLQQQCYARPRHVLVGEKVGAPKESHLRVKPKS